MMKVYFAASIRGGRQRFATYQDIVLHLKSRGIEVLSEHVAHEDPAAGFKGDSDIYSSDMESLRECDVLIAEISTPSIGVGYEIGTAHSFGKRLICLIEAGVKPSAMVSGNPDVTLISYNGLSDLAQALDQELNLLGGSGTW